MLLPDWTDLFSSLLSDRCLGFEVSGSGFVEFGIDRHPRFQLFFLDQVSFGLKSELQKNSGGCIPVVPVLRGKAGLVAP